jgi:hypothetical protein
MLIHYGSSSSSDAEGKAVVGRRAFSFLMFL